MNQNTASDTEIGTIQTVASDPNPVGSDPDQAAGEKSCPIVVTDGQSVAGETQSIAKQSQPLAGDRQAKSIEIQAQPVSTAADNQTQPVSATRSPTGGGKCARIEFGDIDFGRIQSFKAKGFLPTCIFDVGASDGSWSRKIIPLFTQANFHIFEPLADVEPSYAGPINDFVNSHEKVTLHKVAVGKESGELTFNHRENNPSSSTSLEVANKALYRQIQLPMVTLDSIIGAHSPVPEFIKIDIQGGELDVLKGCRSNLNKVQMLLLETWLSRGYGQNTPLLRELINFLAPFGFHLFESGDSWRNENGSLISQDFYFVNERCPLASDYMF